MIVAYTHFWSSFIPLFVLLLMRFRSVSLSCPCNVHVQFVDCGACVCVQRVVLLRSLSHALASRDVHSLHFKQWRLQIFSFGTSVSFISEMFVEQKIAILDLDRGAFWVKSRGATFSHFTSRGQY